MAVVSPLYVPLRISSGDCFLMRFIFTGFRIRCIKMYRVMATNRQKRVAENEGHTGREFETREADVYTSRQGNVPIPFFSPGPQQGLWYQFTALSPSIFVCQGFDISYCFPTNENEQQGVTVSVFITMAAPVIVHVSSLLFCDCKSSCFIFTF